MSMLSHCVIDLINRFAAPSQPGKLESELFRSMAPVLEQDIQGE